MSKVARSLGMLRSLAIYYGVPWRGRQLRRFYRPLVAQGSVCFDIGAHAGNRVRCFRQLGARVIAVEPQGGFVALLERLFGADRDVVVVPCAVGRSAGAARMHVSERTPTVTTLSPEWIASTRRDPGFAAVQWQRAQEVPVVTLDSLIARYGVPGFTKIDVEGYEAEVLAGLSQALPALSFEYLPAARGIALACIERLAVLGRYRYNWSFGESLRFATRDWTDTDGMRRRLEQLPHDAPSGDIYALTER